MNLNLGLVANNSQIFKASGSVAGADQVSFEGGGVPYIHPQYPSLFLSLYVFFVCCSGLDSN